MAEAGERQETVDRFYQSHGPCCAGCDWWRHISLLIGECTRSAYVSGAERLAGLGFKWSSLPPSAGHAITTREHVCGKFKDTFDWASLPAAYQRRIGMQPCPTPTPREPEG